MSGKAAFQGARGAAAGVLPRHPDSEALRGQTGGLVGPLAAGRSRRPEGLVPRFPMLQEREPV